MDDFRQLLREIAHCPIAKAIRSGDSPKSVPCHEIVSLQAGSSFQLPEPWSGAIDIAPLLFISSNPSIDEDERYPDEAWDDQTLLMFFNNRFEADAGWAKNLRASRRNGSWSPRPVAFWCHARARADEILQKGRNAVKPGIDFALTEVVHCKSLDEVGVSEARNCCSDLYLERIISVAAARVLIVYGKHAEEAIRRRFGSAMIPQEHGLSLVSIGDNPRMLVFLPHPNRPGPKKTLEANIGDDGLKLIRAHMKR